MLDAREVHTLSSRYHGIIAGFVIPYLVPEDVKQFLKNAHAISDSTSSLYLSWVPGEQLQAIDQSTTDGERSMFHYYPYDWIANALLRSGWKMVEKLEVNYTKRDGSTEEHAIVIAIKFTTS